MKRIVVALALLCLPSAVSAQMLPGGNVSPVWCQNHPGLCICRPVRIGGRPGIRCTPNYGDDYWGF